MRQDPARMIAAMLAVPEAVDPAVLAWWVEQAGGAKRPPPSRVQAIVALHDAGYGYEAISRALSTPPQTVRQVLHEAGRVRGSSSAEPEGEA